MLFDATDLCRHAGIERAMLDAWVEAGWIQGPPEDAGADASTGFSEADMARICLIRDLVGPMGVNEDGIAVILDLLDQIHGLRRVLQGLSSAVAAQHVTVRRRIRSEALGILELERVERDDSR